MNYKVGAKNIVFALVGLSICTTGLAQQLEEIVVTARKQSDSLMEIPDSITVITADAIEDARITTVEGFINLVPNVVALQGIKPGFITITSRGITTIQENEAPMAVVVDGVVVPAIDFINQDLFDLQQVEVLRGPQGSLYGANALAGAINITTKQPTDELEGKVIGEVGNAGYQRIAGSISGPIADEKLRFRVSANYRDEDGTLKNIFDGKEVDFYEELSLRGQLNMAFSDSVQADFRATYVDTSAGSVFNAITDANVPEQINNFDTVKMDYNTPGEDNRELTALSLKIDWDVSSSGSLTFVTGFGETNDNVKGEGDWLPTTATHIDASGLPAFLFDTLQNWEVETKAISQEVRYTSSSDGRARYNVGVYYQKRERDVNLLVGGGNGVIVDPAQAFIIDQDNNDSEQRAVFGQADIDITERFILTLGLRYDSDKRSSVSGVVGGPTPVEDTFSKAQPKVSLAYNWDEDFMTYFTAARGFRSGGFNADEITVGSVTYPRRFESEVADSLELGFKATLVGGQINLSGAIFSIDYDNQQFFFPTLQGQVLTNFPESQIDGAEIELAGNASEKLSFVLGYGVTNAKIVAADAMGSFEGNRSPLVNEYTLNTGVEYATDIAADLELRLRLDYERRGPRYWDVENSLRTGVTNYLNLNAALSVGSWTIRLFGTNVLNERQPVEVIKNFPGILDGHARRPNLERRYGVGVEFGFD